MLARCVGMPPSNAEPFSEKRDQLSDKTRLLPVDLFAAGGGRAAQVLCCRLPVVELLENGEEAPMSLVEVHIIQAWPVVNESEAQQMFKGGEGTQEAYGGARLGIARAP